MDETTITQQGEKFTLVAAVDPETRHLLHTSIALSRNNLTTRRFLAKLVELYRRAPPIMVTDGATIAHARGRVHAQAQVFPAPCLRLVVAIANYERRDNPGNTIITVCEEFHGTLLNIN